MRSIRESGQCLQNEKRPAFRGRQLQQMVRFVLQSAKAQTMTVIFADSILKLDFQRRTESLARSLPAHISAATAIIST